MTCAALAGGAATQPLWVLNIAANSQVTVHRGQRTGTFAARILAGPECSLQWTKLVQAYPPCASMQAKTNRALPVVLLARAHRH